MHSLPVLRWELRESLCSIKLRRRLLPTCASSKNRLLLFFIAEQAEPEHLIVTELANTTERFCSTPLLADLSEGLNDDWLVQQAKGPGLGLRWEQ